MRRFQRGYVFSRQLSERKNNEGTAQGSGEGNREGSERGEQ